MGRLYKGVAEGVVEVLVIGSDWVWESCCTEGGDLRDPVGAYDAEVDHDGCVERLSSKAERQ